MQRYLTTNRHRPSVAKHSTLLAATQSDRARLIYSAAFRRLQQKAQVFSLESNSSVRSRLTHSIEVSHIGRYIVASITDMIEKSRKIKKNDRDCWSKNSLAIANMVEISCLAHDIGNPPFGHFGEAAIKEWASVDGIYFALKDAFEINDLAEAKKFSYLLNDFHHFDGNPQGFRILTKLQGEDGLNGLNLTYSQLASFLKYTYCPSDDAKNILPSPPFSKKIGFFDSEKNIILCAWNELGISHNKRHPLSFLMEASDDISYCISDIEDGIEKKIISTKDFSNFVVNELSILKSKHVKHTRIINELIRSLNSKDKTYPISNFLSFKTSLSNYLVEKVSRNFVNDYYNFMNFNVNNTLISKGTIEYDLLEILKNYTSAYLFTSYEAEKMELSGFAIIKGILDEYSKILSLTKKDFLYLLNNNVKKINESKLHIERRLFNRLPDKHLNAYKTAVAEISIKDKNWSDSYFSDKYDSLSKEAEWHLRVHLIVDFVSGMTDQFSMDMYQLLKGINIK
ncbi:dGTPase [Enterobacter sp. GD03975]|uniref:dGTPase n=2 Tax=Enterobacter TaxID=547 RepID=UPI002449D9DF|nr:dGTPase [Enterobacter sp. GD03975]MDH1126722.1 dGTPase [Enterobacter sp. GD03975]